MAVQPFKISIAVSELQDLSHRIAHTRWPSAIAGAGWAMGMDADYLRRFAGYWLREFDWPEVQAQLNELPQFLVNTDHGPIHFVHLHGAGPSPTPIVLTHGWPGTFAELVSLGKMLADPIAHGGSIDQSFDVVIPSLPGFTFSPPPSRLGTNSVIIAGQWVELMDELGYPKFIAHGGDIGAGVSTALGLYHPEHLMGLHLNFIPGSYVPPADPSKPLSDVEREYLIQRTAWVDAEGGYSHAQATKPDVLGPALNDSPVGLAAWIIDKYRSWSDCGGEVERRFTRKELLTVVSLYWFTRCMPSAIRLYWEGRRRPLALGPADRIRVPVAVARFPRELPMPPRSYVERGYNVVRWTEFERGGHFAAMEEPVALAADIREFADSLSRP